MLGLALDDGGLGRADLGGAALRLDRLLDQVDARLRGSRLNQRRAQCERGGGYQNTPHDVLPLCLIANVVGLRAPLSRGRWRYQHPTGQGLFGLCRHFPG